MVFMRLRRRIRASSVVSAGTVLARFGTLLVVFTVLVFIHLAVTAFRALSLRSFGVILDARDGPPLDRLSFQGQPLRRSFCHIDIIRERSRMWNGATLRLPVRELSAASASACAAGGRSFAGILPDRRTPPASDTASAIARTAARPPPPGPTAAALPRPRRRRARSAAFRSSAAIVVIMIGRKRTRQPW